ncbi:hypothetical protein [Oceaniglobus trochenteri]|uniref:hypothetical protein n=1 Tax=Oceaniglobus trochenteri TaxID=2763260 RepID=UPI001CFFA2BA|nr:hypothetical protein [Oceaniglobus trochenteri]
MPPITTANPEHGFNGVIRRAVFDLFGDQPEIPEAEQARRFDLAARYVMRERDVTAIRARDWLDGPEGRWHGERVYDLMHEGMPFDMALLCSFSRHRFQGLSLERAA